MTAAASVTGQDCPSCGARGDEWCRDHSGMVRGGALLTCPSRLLTCNGCGGGVAKLDLFPGGICLECHAAEHETDSPADLLRDIVQGFGGR